MLFDIIIIISLIYIIIGVVITCMFWRDEISSTDKIELRILGVAILVILFWPVALWFGHMMGKDY